MKRFLSAGAVVVCGGAAAFDPASETFTDLDAPRVSKIPAVVLCDQPLAEADLGALRPAITVMKPLQIEEAQEIMRGGRSATWRETAFIRGLSGGSRGIVLH